MNCIHNQRTRYTHGFYCEECNTFFAKDSAVYRQYELLPLLYIGLHNINVYRYRDNKKEYLDVIKLQDKIGVGVQHDNYEDLITEAEILLTKYNGNVLKSVITVKVNQR